MVFGKQTVWVGALTVALVGFGAGFGSAMQGQSTEQSAPSTPQQNVPDAPRPQALPQLNSLTPVGAALPSAPAPQASSAPAEAPASDGQTAPGSTLPSSPAASAQAPDNDNEGAPPPRGADAIPVFRVHVNYVQVPFTVKDNKNQLVPALTWRDVRIYENGLRQQMQIFGRDASPMSVALVIDQSVTFDTMTKINNSLHALQDAFAPYDEVSVFTYNNGVKEQTTFTAAQSARLGVVLERSKAVGREPNMSFGSGLDQTTVKNNQQVDPNTTPVRGQQGLFVTPPREFHTLLDAILAAAIETTHAGKDRLRVVYVISDGKEYGSTAKEKEVIKFCQTNNIEVFATLVGDSAIRGLGFIDRIHLPLTMRDDVLPRITALTGGQTDPEFRQGGIEKSFGKITEQVRYQYTIGYYSHEPIYDGKFRKIEVRVMKPDLTVISKDGYFPTPRNSTPLPVTPTAVP